MAHSKFFDGLRMDEIKYAIECRDFYNALVKWINPQKKSQLLVMGALVMMAKDICYQQKDPQGSIGAAIRILQKPQGE